MSFSNVTEEAVLNYIFDSTAASWAGNANFWIALHTADPGEAGTAITSETAYAGYARVAVSRTTGFTVAGDTVTNAALIQFPQCSGAGATLTHFSVVTTASGAGDVIIRGALSASLVVGTGVQPQFAASGLSATLN
jgi:hypothetical protein